MAFPFVRIGVVVFAVSLGLAQVDAAEIYWVEHGGSVGRIRGADLDGTNVVTIVSLAGASPNGIAVDASAGKVYWTDPGLDTINRANLDGSEVENLAPGAWHPSPRGIALDTSSGKMYWTDAGQGAIRRANLDGTSVEDIITMGLLIPNSIALDPLAEKLYWTDLSHNRIGRANLDGSDVEYILTGLNGPNAMTLDLSSGMIYWQEYYNGKIRRANLDGTGVQDLFQAEATRMALGPSGLALYWTDFADNLIVRANIDGSAREDLIILGELASPLGITVVPDSRGCPDDDGDGFVTVCHIPPGNPDNAHTITVGCAARDKHLAHGDHCGPCGGDGGVLLRTDDGEACPADWNGDDVVDASDLAILLGSWGPCEGCSADLDGNGQVGPFDLALLLGNWGQCP